MSIQLSTITIDRGESCNFTFNITNKKTKKPFDLSGITELKIAFKEKYDDAFIIGPFSSNDIGGPQIFDNPENGIVKFLLSSDYSKKMYKRDEDWQGFGHLKGYFEDNTKKTLCKFNLKVEQTIIED